MKTDPSKNKKQEPQEQVPRSEGKIFLKYFKGDFISKVSYGELFKVQNKETKTLYACRQLAKNKIDDIQKFNAAISSTLQVDCASVSKLVDVYEDERNLYMINELCEGVPLFDFLLANCNNNNFHSEKQIAKIFKQMATAVHSIHSKGVAHKDIKQENFIVLNKTDVPEQKEEQLPITTNEPTVMLLDTGISKIFGEFKTVVIKRTVGSDDKGSKHYNAATKTYTAYLVPPELLNGSFEEKSDIWSLGVLLYIMISGLCPFKGETPQEILKSISRKKCNFHEPVWKTVSDDIKDLLKHMICEVNGRYTAQQVLEHEWVKNEAPNGKNEPIEGFDLATFQKLNTNFTIKKTLINIIANKIPEDDIIKIKETFDELKGEDGFITIDDIKAGFSKIENGDIIAESVFKSIDIDGNGKIDYNEFLIAGIEQFIYFRDENLHELFNAIDKDGSGKLSKQEILWALSSDGISEETLNKYIEACDLNGDGELEYDEFIKMLEKVAILPINVDVQKTENSKQ